MMETLYDDSYYYSSTMNNNVNQLKRKMTLDLDNKTSVIKKAKMLGGLQTPQKADVLSSPDLHMLKLASPELERFIISHQNLVTTTPTQVFFPRNVTEEQELYAKGFADALAQLQNNSNSNHGHSNSNSIQQQNYNESSNSSNDSMSDQSESNSSSSYTTNGQLNTLSYSNNMQHPNANNMSGGSANPTSVSRVNDYYNPNIPVHVKEEPQTVPSVSTPPMSPIDMASQEKIKLERKRQRNRVAASKCRKRKLERISRLEDKVKQLKGENSDLTNVLSKLKENVSLLKQQVMEHVHNGCQIMISSNLSSF
jgi:transcription factor AP-1